MVSPCLLSVEVFGTADIGVSDHRTFLRALAGLAVKPVLQDRLDREIGQWMKSAS